MSAQEAIDGWESGLGELGDEFGEGNPAPWGNVTNDEWGNGCEIVSSVRAPLPSTCTVDRMTTAGECAVQIPLDSLVGTDDLNLQFAFGTCPGSKFMPFMSMRIGGAGATKLLAPCQTDAQCGVGHKCFDLAKAVTGSDGDNVWGGA